MKFTRSNTCNPTVATPKRCTGCEHITHHAHIPPTWLTQPPSSLPITSKSPPTMISCKISWADGLPGSFPRLHICTNQWVTASSLRNTKDKMTAWLPIYPVEEFKKLLIIASFSSKRRSQSFNFSRCAHQIFRQRSRKGRRVNGILTSQKNRRQVKASRQDVRLKA